MHILDRVWRLLGHDRWFIGGSIRYVMVDLLGQLRRSLYIPVCEATFTPIWHIILSVKSIHVILQMDQEVWTHTNLLNPLVPNDFDSGSSKGKRLIAEWQLSGYSKSALRTGFKMGPFHLDAGHSVFGKWNAVLISHGHADHVFSFASFLSLFSSLFIILPCTYHSLI